MQALKRFKTDQNGATAVVFSLAFIPIVMFAGAALDYGRAASGRAHLQTAVDGAALTLVREAGRLNEGQLRKRGQDMIRNALRSSPGVTADRITVTRTDKTIKVAVAASIKTSVMGLAGFKTIQLGSDAEASWGGKKIELALVLDNTGSMGWTAKGVRKIDALKLAATDLLQTLHDATVETDLIKVSIVPFNTQVRLDTAKTGRTPFWLAYLGGVTRDNWAGYIEDRNQPFDVAAGAPTLADPNSLFPAAARAYSPDLAPIQPLVSIRSGLASLKGTVSAMQPTGYTNITIGTVWGLATLTNAEPMSGAAAAKDVEKVMIVLTDGDNTKNRINGVHNYDPSKIDPRTREACKSARKAATVITIRVVEGNADLLRSCASKPTDPAHPFYRNGEALYHDVQNPADLKPLFNSIASKILATRLTN